MDTMILKIEDGGFGTTITKAVDVLSKGGVIVYPTETCYGIGVRADDEAAIRKVHAVKGQPENKPISIIAPSLGVLEKFGKVDEKTRVLVERFMPGPLTLIVEKKGEVPAVLSGKGIAFRISANKFANELCEKLGMAITATSANLHGEEAIYSGKMAIEVFEGKVDLIIDAGKLPRIEASTIYDVEKREVLREGPVKREEIERAVNM